MGARLFDWRDLAVLQRYQDESVFLDSELLLTRGQLLVPGVLISYLTPTLGIFTCVAGDSHRDGAHVMGQFIHLPGNTISHLTFLAPGQTLDAGLVCELVEYMIVLSGERGAMRLLADADEHSQAYEMLRKCGFAIYNRQRIWRIMPQNSNIRSSIHTWRMATDQDVIPVRNLYNNLVPGLVQQIEPFSMQHPRGMVYYQNGELLAYLELRLGHRGIWVQPFIHPDAEDVPGHLLDFIGKISGRRKRPIYICIRSYQSWLEPAIEELGAKAGHRQAVMVRQLIMPQKVTRPFAIPALEGGQTEISAPIARLGNQ